MTGHKHAALRADLQQLQGTLTRLAAKARTEYVAAPLANRDDTLRGIAMAHETTADALQYLLTKEHQP